MQKISKQLKQALASVGVKLTEEQIKQLDEAQSEDNLVNFADMLLNSISPFADSMKTEGKKALYGELDSRVFGDSELSDIIGKEELERIKNLKGTEKHAQLNAAYKKAIKEATNAAKNANTSADVKAYQQQLSALQKEFEDFKTNSQQELTKQKTELEAAFSNVLLQEKLYNTVLAKGGLSDEFAKNERFVKRMVVESALEKATEKGLVIDPKKLSIAKADGTPLFVKGGATYSIDDLLSEVITDDMKKKAPTTSTGNVETGGGKAATAYVPIDPVAAKLN